MGPSNQERWRYKVLVGYALVCVAALTWPGYQLVGNRLRPFVLGLPLSFAWNVGWVLLTFLVLVVFHVRSGGERK